MNAKTKKPTGKVAQTITAVKNIAKRLTAGKTVAKKEAKPVKKATPEKKPVKSKPAKPNPAPKPASAKSTNPASKKSIRTVPAIPGKVAPGNVIAPRFCIFNEEKRAFVPVPGVKRIAVPGFDWLQLFLHKGKNDFRISEACSGALLATGNKQKVALQMATDLLNKHGKPVILAKIQEAVNRTGVAPGFALPEGVTSPDKPGKNAPKEEFTVTTADGKEIKVTYTPSFMQHLEFRGEISPTGYHSHFGYKGELADVREAARKKANELREAFRKDQIQQARKAKKNAPKPPQVTTRLKSRILAALVDEQKLPKTQTHLDEIMKTTGAESGDVAATLMVLELSGKVKSLPGNCYRLPTAEEQSTAKSAKSPGGSKGRGGKPRGKMSLLDAAAEVLKESNEPLCCKDITRLIFEKKLAESGGLTPHATLSAAMGREISARGKESRFKRADRGLFASNL